MQKSPWSKQGWRPVWYIYFMLFKEVWWTCFKQHTQSFSWPALYRVVMFYNCALELQQSISVMDSALFYYVLNKVFQCTLVVQFIYSSHLMFYCTSDTVCWLPGFCWSALTLIIQGFFVTTIQQYNRPSPRCLCCLLRLHSQVFSPFLSRYRPYCPTYTNLGHNMTPKQRGFNI